MPTTANSGAAAAPLRVLVADDDPIHRSLLAARLVSLGGQTIEAEDGLAAWTKLLSERFDLAIVDLSMPNLDGFGLIQCMRGHPRTRHLPIVVVTSRGDRAAIDAALQAGASSFLVKPIVWSTFEYHIGFLLQLVRSADEARAQSVQVAGAFAAIDNLLQDLCSRIVGDASMIAHELESLKHRQPDRGPSITTTRSLERIDEVCSALQHQAVAVAAILDSRAADVRAHRPETALKEIIAAAVQAVGTAASTANRQLTTSVPPEIYTSTDAVALTLAIRHLLNDAIHGTDEGEELRLTAGVESDGVVAISLTKSTGKDPIDLSRPPRAETEATRRPVVNVSGSTTELLLAKTIIETLDGTLAVKALSGQSCVTTLRLPHCQFKFLSAAA